MYNIPYSEWSKKVLELMRDVDEYHDHAEPYLKIFSGEKVDEKRILRAYKYVG